MTKLDEIKYKFIIELTKLFVEKYKLGEIKDIDLIIKNVKLNAIFIQEFAYRFNEEIWSPNEPELYNNLIEFKIQLSGNLEYLPFRLMINKGFEQEPTYLNSNIMWCY